MMKNNRIKNITIDSTMPILAALKQMDDEKVKLLLVTEDSKFCSLLSIGDIQRAIIANTPLEQAVGTILRAKVTVAKVSDSRNDIIAKMKNHRNDFMPIVDDDNNIVDIIFWEDISSHKEVRIKERFTLPVVIMAGGMGTRLRPLTYVLPKPLIPIGEQTMMEDIMDRFVECGCKDFYVSVNYMADFIRHYFDNFSKHDYHINYFQEDKPLGTAGSLHLLKGKINDTFFVSNCDSVLDEDYGEILRYHRENGNEITMVSAMKSVFIPYGTLETGENGRLRSLHEKPELTFKINTGMYILEPHLLKEIPSDRVCHITHLIEKLIGEERRVGVFPVSEGSWTDIGNWDEYMKYIRN